MEGKPCDGKLSCMVWGGGKPGERIKGLPIAKRLPRGMGMAHIESRITLFTGDFSLCVDGMYTREPELPYSSEIAK